MTSAQPHHDSILIIDFGSQVTQLIARRIREIGVYCEIAPFQSASEAFQRLKPKGVIFSGGPASVPDEGSPRAPQEVFSTGLPVLGICYGQQTMAHQLGGTVESGHAAEFGRADVEIVTPSALFEGIWEEGGRYPVWMSHGDRVTQLPAGFTVKATSENAPYAVASDEARRFYSTMFHPEVVHTPDGGKLLRNFVVTICGCTPDWSMSAYRAEMQKKIRDQVGSGRVICGLSGGVDSAVAAVLIHEAIGDQLTCVFVDHGLMRMNEAEEVVRLFRDHYNIPLVHVEAEELFLSELARCGRRSRSQAQDHRPALHRRLRGGSRQDRRRRFPRPGHALSRRDRERLLLRRPVGDDQEPPQCRRPARAHEHEAGRAAARAVQGRGEGARPRTRPARGLRGPPSLPGTGSGDPHAPATITREKLDILRKADAIYLDEIRKAGLYDVIWQAFAVLLPVRTVGVMGDQPHL